jgi:alanyl-tRNA synthetase
MATLAAEQPDVLTFESTVEAVEQREDGHAVRLSESYFYPESGGQPADRGTIAGHPVAHVRKGEGGITHLLEPADAEGIEPGATVACEVDERFRTYCMRAHTASHVLYGAGRRLLEGLGYGGFGITPEKVRVDFTTSTEIDDGTLLELERLVNRVVWESRPVSWEALPREEALSREAVAFNTKTEEGVTGGSVRVVTVGGEEPWDVAACGGTHVRNTREIGPVSVLERSNPGEGLTRVEFAVGEPGIERRMTEKRAALDVARELGTNVESAVGELRRLQGERDDLAAELSALRDDLVEARIAELREDTVQRNGHEWLVGTVERLDANGLADRAQALAGDGADVVALVNDGALAVAAAGEVNAGEVVEQVTGEFGGGGGGSPTVAQGGGLGADDETVVAFLRGE